MKTMMLISLLVMPFMAQAEILNDSLVMEDLDAVVIETQYTDKVVLEEPDFGSRRIERDLAQMKVDTQPNDDEWQGQLVVLKEIPYSYPFLSRHTLQLRVINEIEAEEARKKDQ